MHIFDALGHTLGSSVDHADGSTSFFDSSGIFQGKFHPTADGGGFATNALGVTVDTIHPVVGGVHHLTPTGTTQLVERTLGANTYYQTAQGDILGHFDPLTGNVTNALGALAFRFRLGVRQTEAMLDRDDAKLGFRALLTRAPLAE
jgi:hypothetical protein